jgi:Zn-dependent peptidase ImmA (M78 family)
MLAFASLTALLTPRAEQGTVPVLPAATLVADASLRDVAVAVYDSARPVIYYNPVVITRLGPALGTFFLAHEYGHIAYGHTRSSALRAEASVRDSLLQEKELEADCYAARMLAGRDPAAVEAAVEFFSRVGEFSYDSEHPSGTRRAARIRGCLT